jgi:DeoR/GlpR family transcriptional regulator of sugar metabolism
VFWQDFGSKPSSQTRLNPQGYFPEVAVMSSSRLRLKRQPRIRFILEELLAGRAVRVEDIAKRFGVDQRTARADIAVVCDFRPRRSPGEITTGPSSSSFHDQQRTIHLAAKRDVAAMASLQFDSTTSIAACAGTTVAMTIAEIRERRIEPLVVTNSLAVAEHDPKRVYFVPGDYDSEIHALVGKDAALGFSSHACRMALVGVSGLTVSDDFRMALYVKHRSEVEVLQAVLETVSEAIVVVANVEKIGHADPWQFVVLPGFDLAHRKLVVVTNRVTDWSVELKPDDCKRAITTLERLRTIEENQGGLLSVVEAPRGSTV